MGELCFRMGRLDEAISRYRLALDLNPDFYYAYWELAYVHALLEDYPEAMKWIGEFALRAPSLGTRAEGRQWKSFYLFWQGRLEAALAEADILADLAAKAGSELWKAEANRMMGWILLEQGLYDESRKRFRTGMESIRDHQSEFVPFINSTVYWVLKFQDSWLIINLLRSI